MAFDYDTTTGLIKMYGGIGDEVTASDFSDAMDEMEGPVTLRVQSDGGDVIEGMSIANRISDYPDKVRVEIDAWAGSIATVFPMRADEVVAYSNSTIMIHRAWTVAVGNSQSLRVTAEILETLDGTIAGMYADKSGKDAGVFLELMDAETLMNAERAKDLGLIDSVMSNKKTSKKAEAPMPVACISGEKAFSEYCNSARPRRARVSALLHSMGLSLR